MKEVKLSKVGDGESFKRSKKSRTWFTVNKVVKEGIVCTSNNSSFSFTGKKSQIVYIKDIS